jgi:hypothetical protein
VTRPRGHRPVAAVLLVLGLALGGSALAGCGSSSGSSGVKAKPAAPQGSDPVTWAGAFCGGLGDVIAGVSAIAKSQPTPQGQKDGLLEFSDIAQRAFAGTAQKLTQLGPPRIADGKQVQGTAVNFFSTAAQTVGAQRAKLAALDANDPEFVQKASHLAGPDLGAASTQMQQLTSDQQLAPAFRAAPPCQRLSAAAEHR